MGNYTGYQQNGIPFDDLYVKYSSFTQAGLWGMGYNQYGALGDNSITYKSSPVQTVSGGTNWKLVSSGDYHIAAIKTDGTLWAWGHAPFGTLGNSSTVHKSSPVQTVAGGTNWRQVSCKNYNTTAIKTDGTLWAWGHNTYGQVGNNSNVFGAGLSSPVQTISGGTNWKLVSSGYYHTAAIKTDGTLWAWGHNLYGGLGDNTTTNKSSPVQTISGGTNWRQVAGGRFHTAAIKTDGTLWTWGHNSVFGALGDNSTTHKSSPVQTVSGGTNWKQVASGNNFTAAVKTDGTLWNWGSDASGQLGDNTTNNKSSPVQTVASGTNWKSVACGESSSVAIKTDGTLWSWGYNTYGAAGDNAITHRSSPVQTVSTGTNWKQASTGNSQTLAIRDQW